MIKLKQTELYNPNDPKHRGNCWQTALASVLELPLAIVPHFVQEDVDHPNDYRWNWWYRTIEFLNMMGLTMEVVPLDTPDDFLFVTGRSPRGHNLHHVVIYRDGVMVHDPHPDGTGLASIDPNAYRLIPLSTSTKQRPKHLRRDKVHGYR